MDLVLNLKREYFQEIKTGTKKEEYRLCTPYWQKRIEGKSFDRIIIKLGYPKSSEMDKILKFKWHGYQIKEITHREFGNKPVKVYAIQLKERIY